MVWRDITISLQSFISSASDNMLTFLLDYAGLLGLRRKEMKLPGSQSVWENSNMKYYIMPLNYSR